MSYFEKIAMEGADLGYENEAPLANGEETHTVANEIAEVQGLAQEAADAEDGAQQLDDESEKTEELAENVEADVAAENILDPTAAKFLRLAFKNIVGVKHADKTLPATESWSGTRAEAKESARIALEGIKETLKAFWESIKKQFIKVYTKVKSWVVKTFSAAKKLKERAESLQKKANDTVGTIEDKSFSFGQTKAIAVEGKYSDAGSMIAGLKKAESVLKGYNLIVKSSKIEDAAEEFAQGVEQSFKVKGKGAKREISKNFAADFAKGVGSLPTGGAPKSNVVGDVKKFVEMYGDSKEIDVTMSDPLPGGRAIIIVKPKNTSPGDLEEAVKAMKNCKVVLGNDRFNPREVSEGDVKTLTTSQIDGVCDSVVEIAEHIFEYEKNWAEQDRFADKMQKKIDEIVKEFDSEEDADSRDQRIFRNFAQGYLGFVRRNIMIFGNLCSYGLTTGNAFLNYAERSLGQHKSK